MPILSSDLGTLVGRNGINLKQIENEFKCHLKALKNDDENVNIEIKVWADNYININRIKESLLKKLPELALTQPTLEFKFGKNYSNEKSIGNLIGRNGSRINQMEKVCNCRIKLIKNDAGQYTGRIWAATKDNAHKIKSMLLNKIRILEEEQNEYLIMISKSEQEHIEDDWEIDDLLDVKYCNSRSFAKKYHK